MRMKADSRRAPRIDVEIVEEHKRLDQLADVRRTDEPRDRPMRMSAGTVGNRSRHFHCAGPPMRADRAAARRAEAIAAPLMLVGDIYRSKPSCRTIEP